MFQRILLGFACLLLLASQALALAQTPKGPADARSPAPENKAKASLQKATLYLESGKVSEAEKALLEVLPADPQSSLLKEVEQLFAEVQAKGREKKQAAAQEKAVGAMQYLLIGDYANAEKLSREGLKLAPEDSEARKQCEALLVVSLKGARDLKRRKQLDRLEVAQRQIDNGKLTEASTSIQAVLTEADDWAVLAKARKLWLQTQQGWLGYYWSIVVNDLAVLKWPFYGAVILGVLYLLLRLFRSIYQRSQNLTRILQIDEISDATDLSVQDLMVEALYQYNRPTSPATAGLLRLEASPIPAAPFIKIHETSSSLELTLGALPALGGTFQLKGLDKAFREIGKWFKLTPPYLKGKVSSANGKISAFFTLTEAKNQIKVITASSDSNLEGARDLAESLAYKVLYLFYNQALVSVAEAQETLRQGMQLLGQYSSGIKPEKLDEARKLFEEVLKKRPELEEAHLYQGFALDLLERHDEAIRHFAYVKTHAQGELQQRAAYNEAVSHLRKYTPQDLDEAIRLLRHLLNESLKDKDLAASPIKALAYAAEADAIAHKPLFFRRIPHSFRHSDSLEELLQDEKSPLVEWKKEVEQILKELGVVLQTVTASQQWAAIWDELACHQLEWAIEKVRGGLYLNLVICLKGLQELPETSRMAQSDLPGELEEYLHRAEKAFRTCELLLPPGVETLSSIGTLLIQQKEYARARSYLERVIKLNKDYEYAYYRLAQSYDEENLPNRVKMVMSRFGRAPHIHGFQRLYRKHGMPFPTETG